MLICQCVGSGTPLIELRMGWDKSYDMMQKGEDRLCTGASLLRILLTLSLDCVRCGSLRGTGSHRAGGGPCCSQSFESFYQIIDFDVLYDPALGADGH